MKLQYFEFSLCYFDSVTGVAGGINWNERRKIQLLL